MVSREKIQEGSLERCIVLRFHHYIDKHSLSSLGAFREAPGENKQYAFAVLARISLELLSVRSLYACIHVHVKRSRVRTIKVGEVLCLYVLPESARARVSVGIIVYFASTFAGHYVKMSDATPPEREGRCTGNAVMGLQSVTN
jgi:hypothetical protein